MFQVREIYVYNILYKFVAIWKFNINTRCPRTDLIISDQGKFLLIRGLRTLDENILKLIKYIKFRNNLQKR